MTIYQWEFQDSKMEVLYHIRPYFVGIFPYIALIGTSNQSVPEMAIEYKSQGLWPGGGGDGKNHLVIEQAMGWKIAMGIIRTLW